ncbi:MAG: hypothetical protein M3X11_11925 [Acidobacteriota bacterium]|nr:hypothetical protein [Acidobacteriota bacterium]
MTMINSVEELPLDQHQQKPETNATACEPSLREVLLLALMVSIIFVAVVVTLDNYGTRAAQAGDNRVYAALSSVIRERNLSAAPVTPQFWGLPYLAALVAVSVSVGDTTAIVLISVVASFVSIALAHRLWGGWVAAFFAIISWDWIQRSLLGGAEPLFVACLFGAFLAARSKRWLTAALLASLSTTVRPLGLLALMALAIALAWRREFRTLALAAAVGLLIGVCYVLPLALAFGNPLANVQAYRVGDWAGQSPISWPLVSVVRGLVSNSSEPLANMLKIGAWVAFTLAGVVAMIGTERFRQFTREHRMEAVFAALYLLFLFSYNSPRWNWAEFPRFVVPVVPFLLIALSNWLPKHRAVLWGAGALSALLAAASAINVRHAWQQLGRLFGGGG